MVGYHQDIAMSARGGYTAAAYLLKTASESIMLFSDEGSLKDLTEETPAS